MFKPGIRSAACALLLVGSVAYGADQTDPENTAKNVRDRDADTLTVFDQGGSEADRGITAKIRQAVVDDDALSTNAHNVKIITVNGVVTLRGPVDTPKEKTTVETLAKNVAGVTKVESQLEVDTD
jgi:osmotically-inducible protein OsmY